MNASVLSIGVNRYDNGPRKLNNAVNDAIAIGQRLEEFGYQNYTFTDLTSADILERVKEYETSVNENKMDVIVFYYAGHGCEVIDDLGGHVNCILGTDSCSQDGVSLLHTSVPLQYVINILSESSASIKVFIIDACRESISRTIKEDILANGFCPLVSAPRGTIIAFSTSHASTAMDGGGHDGHSIYTSALLDLIGEDMQIEELFKCIRGIVAEGSNQTQISWEFSSLMGNFKFNFDKPQPIEDNQEELQNTGEQVPIQEVCQYSQCVLADSIYVCDPRNAADKIIEKFKTHNWYKQHDAIIALYGINKGEVTKDQQFLIGRNILQSAIGGEYECGSVMNGHLAQFLTRWTINGVNHMLNGMLYEMYFDNRGELRHNNRYKSKYCDEIFDLLQSEMFKPSFEYINNQLFAQSIQLFFYPNTTEHLEVQIEHRVEKVMRHGKEVDNFILDKILINRGDVLQQAVEDDVFAREYRRYTKEELQQRIQNELCAPKKMLTFIWSAGIDDEIEVPSIYNLIRVIPK